MSKTIRIDNHIIDVHLFADFCAHHLLPDGITVAANALDQPGVPRLRWLATSLIAMTESGAHMLTPRGTDLRASLPQLLTEPKPETAVKPCTKCNGSGEQPLFVSMETCSRCKGSKVEPFGPSGVDINALIEGFNGVLKPTYEIQGCTDECAHVAGGFMVLHCAGEDYYWRLIGNVRLRLADGDPS